MLDGTYGFLRSQQEGDGGLDEPPFDSELGHKIFKNVSRAAWGEWVDRQKMLLNEYRLQPWTPQAQNFLCEQMEQFFFGEGLEMPSSTFRPRSKRQGSVFWDQPLPMSLILFGGFSESRERTEATSCKLMETPEAGSPRAGSIVSGRGSAW